MAYTVLARKYRSQTFDDIVGQDPIAQTLRNAIKSGRVAHAFLFVGTRGVGKTTMARILAKAINCLSVKEPTTTPCCQCQSCLAVNAGEDIDVIEIDGATNNGVDQVRELRQNAIYRPARSRYKIYIIDEVHMLSTGAFNALLKILEEPPSHVKFIFATTEPNKVLPTIQSRCQRFDFRNISPKNIAEQLKSVLKQENIKFEDDLLLPIARMANGSMRDGLSLLDRLISTGQEPLTTSLLEEFLGCPNSEKICTLISRIGDSDAAGVLEAAEELICTGLSEVQIVDSLVDYMRDMMVVKSTGGKSDILILSEQQKKQITQLAEKYDIAGIIYNITALEKLRWTLKNSDTARALLDAMLLRIALSEHFLNVDDLLSRAGAADPAPVKKNEITREKPHRTDTSAVVAAADTEKNTFKTADEPNITDISESGNIESIRNNWQNILSLIGSKLGNGTAGILSVAKITKLENGFITLSFPHSAEMSKQMCERNGRLEQIEAVLSDYAKSSVKLKLEIETEKTEEKKPAGGTKGISTERRNEILNDPAVKTVLMGLDARPVDIDQDSEDI